MHLTLRDDLLFVTVSVVAQGRRVDIPDVVVDTGSGSTMLSADRLSTIGVNPEPDDILYTVRGVGGTEVVFVRSVERLQVGTKAVCDFDVEVGGVDYGFDLNGIPGMDFLLQTGAVINLRHLTLSF